MDTNVPETPDTVSNVAAAIHVLYLKSTFTDCKHKPHMCIKHIHQTHVDALDFSHKNISGFQKLFIQNTCHWFPHGSGW